MVSTGQSCLRYFLPIAALVLPCAASVSKSLLHFRLLNVRLYFRRQSANDKQKKKLQGQKHWLVGITNTVSNTNVMFALYTRDIIQVDTYSGVSRKTELFDFFYCEGVNRIWLYGSGMKWWLHTKCGFLLATVWFFFVFICTTVYYFPVRTWLHVRSALVTIKLKSQESFRKLAAWWTFMRSWRWMDRVHNLLRQLWKHSTMAKLLCAKTCGDKMFYSIVVYTCGHTNRVRSAKFNYHAYIRTSAPGRRITSLSDSNCNSLARMQTLCK